MIEFLELINLDNSCCNKDFYSRFNHKILDLTDIKGVNYICDLDTIEIIENRIEDISLESFKYFGSGNYHYLTYSVLNKLRSNFSLVLFDNHVEMLDMRDDKLISCGSWLRNVIGTNKYLKEVYLIGVKDSYIDIIPKSVRRDGRIKIISQTDILQGNFLDLINPKYDIYLSIDKDVFSEKYVKTNWDQGILSFKHFFLIFQKLRHKKIIGVDMCGEERYSGGNIFDSNRLEELEKDKNLNQSIIDCIFYSVSKI